MVEVVLLVEVVMHLVEMVTMTLTTMASKEGEGLEAPTDKADLQVDTVIEAGEMVVGIMVEELDDDDNGNRPEYRDHHRFRLHNVVRGLLRQMNQKDFPWVQWIKDVYTVVHCILLGKFSIVVWV